ncbi:MAG: hypothetical protein JNK46_05800 [Methylobacteriaceae bacterium]|nr:hypothetical protein [Methylobacteriaceae bacterium]
MADVTSPASLSTLRNVATTVAIIGAVAIGLSITLDQSLRGGLPRIALVKADGTMTLLGGASVPAPRGVDLSPVGSIDRIKVDPCTGQPKK